MWTPNTVILSKPNLPSATPRVKDKQPKIYRTAAKGIHPFDESSSISSRGGRHHHRDQRRNLRRVIAISNASIITITLEAE
jgi:hypothetical protein